MNGTISAVFVDRGFGFVLSEDGREYFFHRSALARPLVLDRLAIGQPVRFVVQSGPNGQRAARVRAAPPTQ